jgi:glycosyltransferase involved in cell wall biosynthesis
VRIAFSKIIAKQYLVTQVVPSVLLLIPAYNEERRIAPVLRDYATYFRANYPGRFELVVVLNGCTDGTLDVVQDASSEFPEIRALNFPAAIGKGGALIEGLKLWSTADLIGYVDADGATAPAAFLDLVKKCDRADCVIGSRWLPGAILHQSQSGKRQFASRIFHMIVQGCFWMNLRDTQCGAKVMKREAVERVHSALRIADMAFDINLLYVLKRAGYSVLEVPTEWTDQIGSKVVLGKTSLVMFLSVMRLRLVYSPFYRWLQPLRPIETWIYRKLSAPPPLPDQKRKKPDNQ